MKKTAVIALVITAMIFLSGCNGQENGVDGNGTIEAVEVDIAAMQSGQLEEIKVREGDRVEEGDELARIDTAILDLRLMQAEAGLRQAEAQLELLKEGPHPEDLRQARAKLEQAEEQLSLAEKEWERTRTLYSEGSITKQRYDTGEANYKITRAGYEAAEAALGKLEHLARPQELSSAEDAVRRARGEVEILKKNLADSTLTAALTGVVTEIYFERGELVQAGRPVFTLRDPEKVYVTVYLPEPQLADISLGEPAEIHIDGHENRPFSGKITHISSEAEFTPKNVQTKEQRVKLVYAVRIDAVNEDGILKPGMPADVVLVPKDE